MRTMTIDEAKKRLVAWCNSQVGYREGANNFNKYADLHDIKKLYGWYPQNQPWCDLFVDAAFIINFGYDLASAMTYQFTGSGSAACATSAGFYKQRGAWYSSPNVGDQVFFVVNGGINHTGIVTAVGMGALTTVEGNSSDMVARRTYTIGSPNIAGFGRPRWDLVQGYTPAAEDEQPEEPAPALPDHLYHDYQYQVRVNLLKLGDYGPQVRNVQAMLKAAGIDCPINSKFDDATYTALQKFQEAAGIEADGEFGGATFTTLYNFQGE